MEKSWYLYQLTIENEWLGLRTLILYDKKENKINDNNQLEVDLDDLESLGIYYHGKVFLNSFLFINVSCIFSPDLKPISSISGLIVLLSRNVNYWFWPILNTFSGETIGEKCSTKWELICVFSKK